MKVDLIGGAKLKSADRACANPRTRRARLRQHENGLAIGADVVEETHVALHGPGKREKDRAEQNHVVDAEAAAHRGLIIDTVGEAQPRQELLVIVLAQPFRQTGC